MTEICPYCGREVEGGLTDCLENGNPACAECVEKEEAALAQRQNQCKTQD